MILKGPYAGLVDTHLNLRYLGEWSNKIKSLLFSLATEYAQVSSG